MRAPRARRARHAWSCSRSSRTTACREEVAGLAGVDADLLARQWRALGMPDPVEGEKAFGESDVEAAKRVRILRENLGIPDDEMLQVSRVIGMNMSQLPSP